MLQMDYHIRIGKYRLAKLEKVEIHKSVDLLADTAVITVPGVAYNQALDVEGKIAVGDAVTIRLGYDGALTTEFEGYLVRIDTDDSTLSLHCEDALFLTRKPVANKSFGAASVRSIVEYVLTQVGIAELNCTLDTSYRKFVIHNANGYDVLKKLQEETKANIYMRNGVLNVHPAYVEKGGDVVYDFARNIEAADLKYRRASDKRYEVQVEGIGLDGKRKVVTVGTSGGEKRSIKIASVMDEEALRKRGEEELKYLSFDGYEGSITGWLIPYVEPSYSAKIMDAEYEYKTGTYYVVSVTTTFSEAGGERKVELGRKLAGWTNTEK